MRGFQSCNVVSYRVLKTVRLEVLRGLLDRAAFAYERIPGLVCLSKESVHQGEGKAMSFC